MSSRSVRLDTQKLIALLEGKGWDRARLVDVAGVSTKTIDNVFGGRPVDRRTAAALARAFGVPAQEFVTPENKARSETPDALRGHINYFESLIEDKTVGFTGRRFVFDAINEFLDDPNIRSGYLVIQGDPGIGKTSLVAKLVQKLKLKVYHFNVALEHINTRQAFLTNVCSQLIVSFDLPYTELPDDFDENSVFFTKLLTEAVRKTRDTNELVIAIDALDEVDPQTESDRDNPLCLPANLPKGVYIIVTARPRYELDVHASNVRHFPVEWDKPENRKDIGDYLEGCVGREGINKWMRDNKLTAAEFVESMSEKSEGNFMYLHHVLPAIEAGTFSEEGIDGLPIGLRAYYRRHWHQMRDAAEDEFDSVSRPIICVLAAVYEPVSDHFVSECTQLELRHVVAVLRSWQEFLHVRRDAEGQMLYRVYHISFKEFLQEEIDPGLRQYHRMIAARALNGLDETELQEQ